MVHNPGSHVAIICFLFSPMKYFGGLQNEVDLLIYFGISSNNCTRCVNWRDHNSVERSIVPQRP